MRAQTILAIETSCDETAVSVVTRSEVGMLNILSNLISSQIEDHKVFGGVVPEIASRKHLENLNPLVEAALFEADITPSQLDAVAVTIGPGLIGALHMGLAAAKAISFVADKPLIGVHHLDGHISAITLEHGPLEMGSGPLACLIASGGHTMLVIVRQPGVYEVVGSTFDDAIGEAYDKVAKLMDLGYPGGPLIDEMAARHHGKPVRFTPPMLHTKDLNFSFSGIKTAVMYHVEQTLAEGRHLDRSAVAAGFQGAVVKVAVKKLFAAAEKYGATAVAVVGGVSANKALRQAVADEAGQRELKFYFPSFELCTDNAAMIAFAAFRKLDRGEFLELSAEANPSLKL